MAAGVEGTGNKLRGLAKAAGQPECRPGLWRGETEWRSFWEVFHACSTEHRVGIERSASSVCLVCPGEILAPR